MCTAISLELNDAYFGRNLDLDASFGEQVVITPRDFRLLFRMNAPLVMHHAMVGMARVENRYPLYAEAINEKGIAMAALNFPHNALYATTPIPKLDNLAPFEVIPWVLGQAGSLSEARALLERLCVVNLPFRGDLSLTPLHWFITDGKSSLVLETDQCGVRIYENPLNVLTNNPPFPYQLAFLASYSNLSNQFVSDSFSYFAGNSAKGLGNGARGLPGDFSSSSRFVRASWLLQQCTGEKVGSEGANVGELFALLASVAPIRGSVLTEEGKPHYTIYSCCANLTKGIFYLKTKNDPQIRQVDLKKTELQSCELMIASLSLSDFEKDGAESKV